MQPLSVRERVEAFEVLKKPKGKSSNTNQARKRKESKRAGEIGNFKARYIRKPAPRGKSTREGRGLD